MHLSNPITPRTTEISQQLLYCKWQITNIRKSRETAPVALYSTLNISLDHWLNRLNELQNELAEIEKWQKELQNERK